MRFLKPEEVAALTEAIAEHYQPLVLTAAYCGLRWGELAGLAADRVDLLHRTIRVERQLLEVAGRLSFGPPKTRAGIRSVTIPRSLADRLGEHLTRPPVVASGLAFPGPKGATLRRGNFRRVLLKACADAASVQCASRSYDTRPWPSRSTRAPIRWRSKSASDTRRSPSRWTHTAACSPASRRPSPRVSTTCSARHSRDERIESGYIRRSGVEGS